MAATRFRVLLDVVMRVVANSLFYPNPATSRVVCSWCLMTVQLNKSPAAINLRNVEQWVEQGYDRFTYSSCTFTHISMYMCRLAVVVCACSWFQLLPQLASVHVFGSSCCHSWPLCVCWFQLLPQLASLYLIDCFSL